MTYREMRRMFHRRTSGTDIAVFLGIAAAFLSIIAWAILGSP